MEACSSCGAPRTGGKRFCTRCGTRFPDTAAAPGTGHRQSPLITTRRPRYRSAAFGAAGVALLVGIGIGAWLVVGGSGSHSNERAQRAGNLIRSTGPTASAPAAGSPEAGSPAAGSPAAGSPAAGSVPSSTPAQRAGTVAISAAAASDPSAPRIAAFLDKYFAAINSHNYQAYEALLGPQVPRMTSSQFDSGYGSTADSQETLREISSAAGGDSVAQVTFTSHQRSAASATNSACTVWNISLYLTPNADSYLIDNPPSSYRAQAAACR